MERRGCKEVRYGLTWARTPSVLRKESANFVKEGITLRYGRFTIAREVRESKVLTRLIRLDGSARTILSVAMSLFSIHLRVKKEQLCSKVRILEGT